MAELSFFEELKRRNVVRVGVVYLITAWLLAQVADLMLENFHAPDWVIQAILVVLIIGFPLALILAWAFELTPDGVKKEKDVDRSQSITTSTGRKLDFAIIGILVLALGYFVWESRINTEDEGSSPGENVIATANTTSEAPGQQMASPGSGNLAETESSNSIAVLPFVNMSGDADNEFFSDGVSEEILNVLARIPGLKVAARTSAFGYKGTTLNISEIADQLHVANILEGSVRKSGNQVRVTAQLIKADDGFHIWSETYDRQLDNIFAIQDEIATAIADELKFKLNIASGASGNLTGTTSLEAYEHYLKGMSLWHLRTPDNLYSAIDEFNQAIAIDPGFARAYAGLSLAWIVLPGYVGSDQENAYSLTRKNAERALELDPQLAEPLVSLGNLLVVAGEFEQASRYFEKATQLNPSFATAWQWYGNSLLQAGDREAATKMFQHALEIDPRSRITGVNFARLLLMDGRFAESLQAVQDVLQYAPDFPDALNYAMTISLIIGDCSAVERYGNQLARVLNKKINATSVFVDWCRATDAATRSEKAAIVASWPEIAFSDPDEPTLVYAVEFAPAMIELGEFEATMTLLNGLSTDSIYSDSFTATVQTLNTPNGRAFRCTPEAKTFFSKLKTPPFWKPEPCE